MAVCRLMMAGRLRAARGHALTGPYRPGRLGVARIRGPSPPWSGGLFARVTQAAHFPLSPSLRGEGQGEGRPGGANSRRDRRENQERAVEAAVSQGEPDARQVRPAHFGCSIQLPQPSVKHLRHCAAKKLLARVVQVLTMPKAVYIASPTLTVGGRPIPRPHDARPGLDAIVQKQRTFLDHDLRPPGWMILWFFRAGRLRLQAFGSFGLAHAVVRARSRDGQGVCRRFNS